MFRKFGFIIAILTIVSLASVLCQAAPPQALMTRHVRQEVARGEAKSVGQLPASQVMLFDIVIPLRDRAGLQTLLGELYDPKTPFYHQFITPEDVTQRFGPSQEDWDALVAFAKASGFEIIGGTRDSRDLWLRGSVADMEKAFHVTLGVYQDPTEEGRTFFAPDREPTVDLPFPLWHITGLDNNSKPHPLYVKKSDYAKANWMNPDEVAKPNDGPGSGPSSQFLGSDMRAAYYGGTTLTGTGQNIGLFELAGSDLADLATYYSNIGQTEPYTPTLVSTGGYGTACLDSGSSKCDDIEQTIDMQMTMGVAPGSTMTYMYVCGAVLASGSGGFSDSACISAMVTTTAAPLSKQIGCSWGWSPADTSTLDPYFEQMAAQGQNFFAASGDSAKWSSSNTAFPADDANVVSVGGTDLTTVSAGGAWKSETAWVDSGGGNSPASIPIPSWQLPVDGCSSCSKTLRNGPDVSAEANFDYYYCGDQKACGTGLGGTSFATPLWAGYLALANQQAAANGESIGFINPIIYPQAELGGTTYSTLFHDITSGTCGDSSGTGYDLCTGWGSPNGTGLINLLAPAAGGTTPQTITFTTSAPSSEAYNGSFGVAATASSGLTVAFTASGGCSVVDNGNGSATYTMTSGTTACSVIANQSGNTTYAVAPTVTQTTNATLATQTITFTTSAPASAAYGTHFTVAATGGASGNSLVFTSAGSCSNSGATYTMTSGAGTCSVIANQAGNANYSAAAQVTQTTNATQASQTITFTTSAPASAAYGTNFTVVATGGASGNSLVFTSAGSCSNSGATYTMTSGAGTCSVIANQAGNANYSAAAQVTETTNATLASQTITFTTPAPASAGYGNSFTVVANGGASGNALVFTSSGSCSNSGTTYTMTSGTGTCSVIANQAGNGNYAAAAQVTETTTAILATSSTAVSSSANPSVYSQPVTLTATISGQYGQVKGRKGQAKPQNVTGTVTWSGNTGCGTTTVTSGTPGVATCTTSSLALGTDTITATYSGDSNHNGSSSTLNGGQVVSQASTNVTVGSSLNPSTYGQAVSFTANVAAVAPAGGTPTGTVQFTVDGVNVGSPVTLASGSATSGSTSTLAEGTHTVTAVYSGVTDYAASTGTLSAGQTVNQATAATVVTSSANPSISGQSVTLTATISGQYGLVKGRKGQAKSRNVTGTVAWSGNTGCSASTVTSGNPGTATCTTSTLPVGTDRITATYSGDSNHAGSTGTLSGGEVVNQATASTTTSVASSSDPSNYGQAVSFTATVTTATGTPTGTVQFNVDGGAFGSPAALVSGSATSGSIATLTQGTHTVTAAYSGDTDFAASAGTLSGGQVVSQATAATVVTSSVNPSVFGQSVTLTATISGQNGLVKGRNGSAKPQDVTGSVAWSSNTGCGTTSVTSGNPGVATCTTTTLPVGTDTITATYLGDSNHGSNTGTLSGGQVVNPATASTTTTVGSSLNPSTYGQAVSFTANVASGAGTPTGTVQFSIDGSAFGSPVTLASGSATSGSTSTLAEGTHTVTAVYAGVVGFGTSTGTLSGGQVVNQASVTMTVGSSVNPSVYAQSVTLTATIGGEYGLVKSNGRKRQDVSGTVTWSANTGCGTTTVTPGNPGVATCTTSSFGVGTYAITATYSGDSNHNGSSATLAGGQVVNQASQTITVTVPAPATATNKSSFTVVASASSGLAITFTSAGACTNAGATYTMNSTKVGATCVVGIGQAGNADYAAASVTELTNVAAAIAPTVTFTGAPASDTYLSTFAVATTTNASTTPTITAAPSTVCTISGNVVTMVNGTGTCTLTAAWAADDKYKAATATQKTIAAKASSGLAWSTPAAITYGTLLSSVQLDATANVAGTFVYSPAAGTKPKVPVAPATCDTLKVTFTPTLATDYTKQTATVCLVVNP